MKIVFANRYFFPDQSATSRMVSGLAFALARRGFEVTAITSRTLHDHSNVALPAEEMVSGLNVQRLWATRFGRKNIFGRAIDYLTFHVSAFLWCLWNLKSGDICVVCTDPPLLSVTTALPIRWRRARMVNWVMDLFPEVAMELGMLSTKSIPGTISRSMRNWSMRKSAMIVCPTATMASYLTDRGFQDGQVFVMHHWSDGDEIYPVAPASNSLRTRWGLQDKFVVGYSGNFGRAHDFSTLLEAAVLLSDHDDIQFLLIGGGQQRTHVEEVVRNRDLKNVLFKPLQPPENIAESLSTADAHIVSLIPRLEHCIVPSKFYGVLAAGRPTLFIGDRNGEVARVVATADCGVAVEIGEGRKLADLIIHMKNAPERRMQMGHNARRVLDTLFSRENAVSAWSEVMLKFKQQAALTSESSVLRSCRMTGTVVVSQLGARMHYAVPRIFASEKQLAHFYTDICATKNWPRLVNSIPKKCLPSSVKRLVGRVPKGVAPELISTFPGFGIRSAVRRLRLANVIEETEHAVWAGSEFSRLVASSGFHGAAGLYAFAGDALEQMIAAKQQGMWTAVEQMIAPREVVEELVKREQQTFPGWAGPHTDNPYAEAFAEREKAEWELADIIVCPSEFVRRNVIARGGRAERCVVVPYGIDPQFPAQDIIRIGGPLRVLTVGQVGLRKGSPYVAEAARLLGKSATFRMAGPSSLPEHITAQLSKHVELRGIVPRAEMAAEYEWADVFLLPSICEGSATAVYEALAAGLPVVCTENAGSVVRDGIDGFIVPIRDGEAIANAIATLTSNVGMRAAMSESAVERAADFTVKRYGERLLGALSVLPAQRRAPSECVA